MNSCEGCHISKNGQFEAYQSAKAQAIKWQKESKVNVAIYQEGFEYMYMNAEKAVELGKQIKEFISYKGE